MAQYRRWYFPGGTFFLTVVTWNRVRLFDVSENVERLRMAFREVMNEWPFEVCAAVILPDHFHVMWQLPTGDTAYSKRLGRIKTRFTASLPPSDSRRQSPTDSRRRHRESGVWQRRFWEHTIQDDDDFKAHLDYIHYNPVKHGLVSKPHDWPYSSFGRWVDRGEYDWDWGATEWTSESQSRIANRVGE